MPKLQSLYFPTTRSWNDCANRALILPAAPSRNTAKRCEFRPRCSAAATNRACSAMHSMQRLRHLRTGPATLHRLDGVPTSLDTVLLNAVPLLPSNEVLHDHPSLGQE